MNAPYILDIKGNSTEDGPGIRSVLFLKGCPLNCVWCHNPESKKSVQEISHEGSVCIGCGTCIKTCPRHAVSPQNPFFIDRSICDLCFLCAENCPAGAIKPVGRRESIPELVEELIKDKPFYDVSGGGVTISGGEPTLFMPFLSELCRALKKENIHVLIETCGKFDCDRFLKLVYPYIDMIYCDIKFIDRDTHVKYCGTGNEDILENFLRLHALYKKGGVPILPRTPLIPNFCADEKNLENIAEFYVRNGVEKCSLLSYNPLWRDKNAKLGIGSSFDDAEEMQHFMPKEKERKLKEIVAGRGIELVAN